MGHHRSESSLPKSSLLCRTTDRSGVVFGLVLGGLAAFHQFKLPPVLPLLTANYGYGRAYAGSLMSVYSVAGLLLSWPVGRTLARRGPGPLLAVAFVSFVTGSLLGVASPSNEVLFLLSRLLEGVGFTIAAVVGGVVTIASASPDHRVLATALWATWIPVGQLAGTLVAVPVVEAGAWRPLWWIGVAVTVVAAGWAAGLVRSDRPVFQRPSTDRGVGASDPKATGMRSGGTSLLLMVAGLFGLWSMQLISFLTWLPTYLVEVRGLTPATAATIYLVPPVLIISFNLVAGALLRSGWRLGPLLTGSLVVQVAVWWAVPWLTSSAAGVVALLAFGAAVGVTPTCLFALPAALADRGISVPKGFAALMTGRNLGVLIGPVLLGQLIAVEGGWGRATPLFGLVAAAALVLAVVVGRRMAWPGRRVAP